MNANKLALLGLAGRRASASRRGTSYESRRPGIASVDDGLAHGGGSLTDDQSALEIGDQSDGTYHIGDKTSGSPLIGGTNFDMNIANAGSNASPR